MIRDIINIYIYIIIEVTDNVLTNILPNIPKYPSSIIDSR